MEEGRGGGGGRQRGWRKAEGVEEGGYSPKMLHCK